jgi:4-hydroxy-tetrahydrodipicolinate synthase
MASDLVVVLPTFFDNENMVDFKLMLKHLLTLLESGVKHFVFQGTTSETPTLQRETNEIMRINQYLIEKTSDYQYTKILGIGGFDTFQVIKDIHDLQYQRYCDIIMLSPPYYNKPTQEGIYRHYEMITKTYGNSKFMIYNVPSRTGVNIEPQTMIRICKLDNVVAIKEASGNISQIMEVKYLLDKNRLDKIKLYSGDDGMTLPVLSIGGAGVVSVLGNLYPKTMLRLLTCADKDTVVSINNKLLPYYKLLFIESNPVPLKYLLSLKYQEPTMTNVRLPLVNLTSENRELLKTKFTEDTFE